MSFNDTYTTPACHVFTFRKDGPAAGLQVLEHLYAASTPCIRINHPHHQPRIPDLLQRGIWDSYWLGCVQVAFFFVYNALATWRVCRLIHRKQAGQSREDVACSVCLEYVAIGLTVGAVFAMLLFYGMERPQGVCEVAFTGCVEIEGWPADDWRIDVVICFWAVMGLNFLISSILLCQCCTHRDAESQGGRPRSAAQRVRRTTGSHDIEQRPATASGNVSEHELPPYEARNEGHEPPSYGSDQVWPTGRND
ncbi:hypothetical protein B0H66DRAFT_538713 [Apodospora peruviana]|uniref:Uncharacterized protein n=1 Tax=Apodospora peruviana TaxID=516989 RepID=A0AAE0LYK6_9PEZI|nr:hypothetical protein B0H66DRAFT_538713 [Apodospora peruviana]